MAVKIICHARAGRGECGKSFYDADQSINRGPPHRLRSVQPPAGCQPSAATLSLFATRKR